MFRVVTRRALLQVAQNHSLISVTMRAPSGSTVVWSIWERVMRA